MDIRDELHGAFDEEGFPSASLVRQAMARLDEPRQSHARAWQVVVAAVLAVALVATFVVIRAHRDALNPAGGGWLSADLPGTHSGFRAAAYDASRNCLWIITKEPPEMAADMDSVTLTRVNVTDRSSHPTTLKLSAAGFLNGSVAVDAAGKVWMSWGRTLVRYDPDSQATRNWTFPASSSPSRASSTRTAVVHPEGSGIDGNEVSMAISPDNEIWLLVSSIQAVYGFNPATTTWDRMVRVPLDPAIGSLLLAAGPGKLVMSGIVQQGRVFKSLLAVVDTTTGAGSVLSPETRSFVLIDSNRAVYTDTSGGLSEVDLSTGSTRVLAVSVPMNAFAQLTTDASGRVWFSMEGYRLFGVGSLDVASGAVKRFPFSYIKAPGSPMTTACPTPYYHLGPPPTNLPRPSICPAYVTNPEVQDLVVDGSGHVWVITALPGGRLPGQGDPIEIGPMAPITVLTND